MAIKFPLNMSGFEVRNLEDLQKHFNLNAALDYFKDGRLLKWLESRYYDDEAEKIFALNENAPDFREKLCAALGVDFDDENYLARVEEKKTRLRELTDDESIINNAATTALTQEDLADLLDADTPTIYLCGAIFSIPVRVPDKKYIGVLDPPLIKIHVNSQAEIDAQNISFVNVRLPWKNSSDAEKNYQTVNENQVFVTLEQLKDIYSSNFTNGSKKRKENIWEFVDERGNPCRKVLSDNKKKAAIDTLCESRYTEDEMVHVCLNKDLNGGWAFTKDSLVLNQGYDIIVIPYKDFLFMGYEIGCRFFLNDETIMILYKSGSKIVTKKISSSRGAFNKNVMHNVNKYLKLVGLRSAEFAEI